ncbi:hypothetical protein [Glaciecola sp. 1036]|uniref:hypothetical protein n=1 Tax=Alteromonadaceae TaxID=72275 RepID=UPI003D02415C
MLSLLKNKKNLPLDQYINILNRIINNSYEYEILKDEGVQIQAIYHYILVTSNCGLTKPDVEEYRQLSKHLIGKKSRFSQTATSLLGQLGSKEDLEYLSKIALKYQFEDRPFAEMAIESIVSANNKPHYKQVLETLLNRLTAEEVKSYLVEMDNMFKGYKADTSRCNEL